MIKVTATTQVINKNTGKVEQTITETYTGYIAHKYLKTTNVLKHCKKINNDIKE